MSVEELSVEISVQDYKSLRIAVIIFVPPWLTHTHTAFDRLYGLLAN